MVWNLNSEQCRVLIEGMMLGDGHTMANGTRRYDTSSTRLANDFRDYVYMQVILQIYQLSIQLVIIQSLRREGREETITLQQMRTE